jgi:thiamine-phosphate pyrophosphorylase
VSIRNNPLAQRKPPLLCYVTDRRSLTEANSQDSLAALTKKIERLIAAGVDWVQIREKDLSAAKLAALTRQSVSIAANVSEEDSRASRTRILVNDQLDVAIAERAGGVHLGEKSLPVAEAKRFVESALPKQPVAHTFLVGVSCHSLEAGQAAQYDGADYVFFGPVFSTPSKAAYGEPQGLTRLSEVCRAVSVPVLAIGGITLENAPACINAGAAGIAAIRLFQNPPDPLPTVRQLHQLSMDYRLQ